MTFRARVRARVRRSIGTGLVLFFGLATAALWSNFDAQAGPLVRLALIPVVVHSAEDPAYLREGLADMLASRFEQAGVFEIVRIDDSARATTRLAEAVEAGRAAGADFVLFGSFTRFGTGASLDMEAASTAAESTGVTLRQIFVESGSIGELIPDLEALVGKVTRFAVADYAPPEVAPASPGRPAASLAALEALTKRVAELERQLSAKPGSESTAP